jgi:hypothetical protein
VKERVRNFLRISEGNVVNVHLSEGLGILILLSSGEEICADVG